MKKIVLLGAVSVASILFAYEPSVYGAGDINSATPYGLTETEQAVLENKNALQMLFNRVNEQQRKVDGLMTIIDGQNKEILSLKEQLQVKDRASAEEKNDANKTYSILLEMGQMIDNITNTYVTQEQLKEALAGSRSRTSSRDSSNLGTQVSGSSRGNSADTYRRGVQLFAKRSYGAAKEHFEDALSANYKPAASNYYLAEIAYYTFNYEDAVAHYKKSASLYDNASYMPVLYLHTAISLDKSGESEQADTFYQHVISTYPNTRAASIAKKRM